MPKHNSVKKLAKKRINTKNKTEKMRKTNNKPYIMAIVRIINNLFFTCFSFVKYNHILAFIFSIIFIYSYFVIPVVAREKEDRVNVNAELKRLKSKKTNEKLSAIENLGKSRNKNAIKEIINELKTTQDINTKSVSVITLGVVDSEEANTVLKEIFLDEKDYFRCRLPDAADDDDDA